MGRRKRKKNREKERRRVENGKRRKEEGKEEMGKGGKEEREDEQKGRAERGTKRVNRGENGGEKIQTTFIKRWQPKARLSQHANANNKKENTYTQEAANVINN